MKTLDQASISIIRSYSLVKKSSNTDRAYSSKHIFGPVNPANIIFVEVTVAMIN